MQALKHEGRQGVRLVMDKLYVGNHLVNQHPHTPNQQRRQDGATGTHLSQAPMGPPASSPGNTRNCTVLCTDGLTIRATISSGKIGTR